MKDYKSFVGPKELYDVIGLVQFSLLTFFGLQCDMKVLDIGCGSLRLGKYLMEFVWKGNYYAIEPNDWLVKEALKNECKSNNIIFSNNSDFDLIGFNTKFHYIIANSIFIHASKKQIKKCFQQVHKVIEKEGEFFFNYIKGKDNTANNWSYPNSITYEKETLLKMAHENGFLWNDIDWYYPGKQKWVRLLKKGRRNVIE